MDMDPEFRAVFGDYPTGEETPEGQKGTEGAEGTEKETGEEGAKEQEPTEPAQKNRSEGPTQPGKEGAEENEGAPEEPNAAASDTAVREKPEMSDEERHRQAAARRAREDAAMQAAQQARIDKVYSDMFAGQANPFTGKPILTEADYKAYMAAKEAKEQEDSLAEAGIKPDVIEKLVDQRVASHPAVIQAQRAAAEAELEKAHAAEQEAQTAIQGEIKKISAMDPSIQSLEDLAAMPTAQQFNAYVQKGLSLEDAFYLANRKDIETKRQAAAKQAAINQTRSKQHLESGAGSGGAGITVPAEIAAEYRQFFPEMTEAEIQKEYERCRKSTR